ncbi:hypothetical protein J6590_059095 [Homalodisca vitripennis]|nr:hypothetical protein J6590_059095 [Homalodisca vitripennis]
MKIIIYCKELIWASTAIDKVLDIRQPLMSASQESWVKLKPELGLKRRGWIKDSDKINGVSRSRGHQPVLNISEISE